MSQRPQRPPKPDRPGDLEGPRRLLALAFVGLGAAYLTWRAGTLDAAAPLLSGGLYGLECLGYLLGLLQIVTAWRGDPRPASADTASPTASSTEGAAAARSTDAIVLCGEAEPAVIRKTLLAALAMTGVREVLLLDDGSRAVGAAAHAERADLARTLGCTHLAHPDGLAAALVHGHSPHLLLLRAGDAPRRDLLSTTAGAFDDPRVAAVQVLPCTLDGDPAAAGRGGVGADPLTDPVAQCGRAGWGAALLNGSGARIRRDALAQVGGLDTAAHTTAHTAAGTAGPSLATTALQASLRLQAAGWRITCTDAPLLFRIAPEAAPRRWSAIRAAWGVWRREGRLLGRGPSLAQRLCTLGAVLAPLAGLRLGLLTLLPAAVLLSGRWPVDAPVLDVVLRSGAWTLLSLWLADELGRGRRRAPTHGAAQLGAFAATIAPKNAAGALHGLAVAHTLALATGALGLAGVDLGFGLPADALLATTAAAGIALGLTLAALRQTRRQRPVGRAVHRFPIPLAAELVCPGGERLTGTIDDLSEAGLRFYGTLLPSITIGQPLAGFLHLPDGPLPFEGTVRHLGGETDAMHLPRSIGCSLELGDGARRRLETFLYTTALPWQAQGDRPRTHTLLSALLPGQVDGPPAQPLAPRRWNAAQLRRHVNAPTLPALLAAPDPRHGDDLLISYGPLPVGQPLILDVFRRMAVPSRGVQLTAVTDPATPGVPGLHTYRVEVAEMPRVPAVALALQDPTLLYDDAPVWAPDEPHPVPRTVVSDPQAYQPLELDHV